MISRCHVSFVRRWLHLLVLDGVVLSSHSQFPVRAALNIPDNMAGLVIGKGGVTIKSFQEQSGAKICLLLDEFMSLYVCACMRMCVDHKIAILK